MQKYKTILAILIVIAFFSFVSYKTINKHVEENKVKNAKIVVNLKSDLNIPFNTKHKVSEYIEYINGEIIDDYDIDSTSVGVKKVEFKYKNEDNIVVDYSYDINIVDETAPIIWLGGVYTVNTSFNGNLCDKIMRLDDSDDEPKCEIVGNYDTKKIGSYNLKYVATDKYGNESSKNFVLKVVKPSKGGSGGNRSYLKFSDFISNYKTDETKVGIDVSFWQGDIDFDKVKESGVEFAIIRVGSKNSKNEHYLDTKFKRNIEGFNRVGIPVGVYYYSYTNNKDNSIDDAKWVLEQIKGYNVELGVFYDWENWANYNSYHLSIYNLTNNAKVFLDTISSAGYKGGHYSSKTYLENIWYDTGYPTWLAHYTSKTNYKGEYDYWQMSDSGLVNGIDGGVDLDVMYLKGGNKLE